MSYAKLNIDKLTVNIHVQYLLIHTNQTFMKEGLSSWPQNSHAIPTATHTPPPASTTPQKASQLTTPHPTRFTHTPLTRTNHLPSTGPANPNPLPSPSQHSQYTDTNASIPSVSSTLSGQPHPDSKNVNYSSSPKSPTSSDSSPGFRLWTPTITPKTGPTA